MLVRRRTTRSGFSLIELIIVLAVVGIMATMAVTSLIAARPHAQLEQAEVELIATLNQARQIAVSEESLTRVVLQQMNEAGASYIVERLDAASGTWSQPPPERVRILPLFIKFDGDGTTFAGNTVQFNTRGSLIAGGNIRLAIEDNSESRTLAGNLATGRFNYGTGNLR